MIHDSIPSSWLSLHQLLWWSVWKMTTWPKNGLFGEKQNLFTSIMRGAAPPPAESELLQSSDFLLRFLSGIAAHLNFCKKPMNQSVGCTKPRWRRCWRTALRPVQRQREAFHFSVSGWEPSSNPWQKHASTSHHVSTAKKKRKSKTSSRCRNTNISNLKRKFLITSENMHLRLHCLSDRNKCSRAVWHDLLAPPSRVPGPLFFPTIM